MSGLEVTLAILCVLAFFAGIAVGRLLLPELAQESLEADSLTISDFNFSSNKVTGVVNGTMIEKLHAYVYEKPVTGDPTGFDPNEPDSNSQEFDRTGNTFSLDNVPEENSAAAAVFVAVWGTGCLSAQATFSTTSSTTTTTTTTTSTSTSTSTTSPTP